MRKEIPSPFGHPYFFVLFLFFYVQRVLPQARAVLFQAKFFAARFSADCIVVVPGFLTHEKQGFEFFLGHRL